MQVLEKGIMDRISAGQRYGKNLKKNSEDGDLKSHGKNLAQLISAAEGLTAMLDELKALTEGFDAKVYIESGDFPEQMEYECRQLSVDIKGEYPVYEMFPLKVKIDSDECDVYVDRKKVQCLRPVSFAKYIKASRDRLLKSAFNASSFANELCAAYDTAMTVKNKDKQNARADGDLLLKNLYHYLAPMQRSRREYDAQAFAFDLARLYISEVREIRDGRKLTFGTSKSPSQLIRILDANGREQFIATVRFGE
jgi:hypothetical protein